MDVELDRELRWLRRVTRRFPPLPKLQGVGNHLVRRFYLRRPRAPVLATVHGFTMELDPNELVDGLLLFTPQLHDRREVHFLERHLAPGDTFLDLGAYIGFYSLLGARLVGPTGCVLAVEPEPESHARLRRNLARNNARTVEAVAIGLSDRTETRRLGVNTHGNRGSSSFARAGDVGVDVGCVPLRSLLSAHGIHAVAAAKLDLEGFEHRVLRHYFDHTEVARWPRALVVERLPDDPGETGDVRELLWEAGYRVRRGSRHNLLATRA